MAVLSPRLLIGLVLGAGVGAAVARRRATASEPCCEPPAGRGSCC